MIRRRWWSLAVACLVVGCGRRLGHVAGTVRVDGAPLDYGIINFVAPGGAASAPILDGAFEADGVPLGSVQIAVRALPRPVVAAAAAAGARPFAPLAERYLSPEHSGLSLEVRPGRQRHDVLLTGT
jgi:hypothetical protein